MDAYFTDKEIYKLRRFTKSISSSKNKNKCKNVTGFIDKTTKQLTLIAGEEPYWYICNIDLIKKLKGIQYQRLLLKWLFF